MYTSWNDYNNNFSEQLHTSHSYFFLLFWWVRPLRFTLLASCNRVLSTIVTMLHIRSPEFLHHIPGNLSPCPTSPHFIHLLCAKSLQSCPALCNPMDCSPLSTVLCLWNFPRTGFLEKFSMEWVAMPSSGCLPDPGIEPASHVSLAGGFFTTSASWQAPCTSKPLATTIILSGSMNLASLHLDFLIFKRVFRLISKSVWLSFCVWLIPLNIMSSRFIHVVASGRISFFLMNA